MKLCECGCGRPAPIATMTNRARGAVKGEPQRFISGHNRGGRDPIPFAKRVRFQPVMAGMDTPCWLPAQKPQKNGYVRVYEFGRVRYAHVLMWQAKHGLVPDGLELDHLCRNRWCISPDHLEPVTRAVNAQRGAPAKLTRAQAIEIRSAQGTLRRIAQAYGVSTSAIKAIRNGHSWREESK